VISAGGSLRDVQQLVGHASLNVIKLEDVKVLIEQHGD